MPTLVHRRVTAAREGTNPNVIATMASGFAVLGDFQFFRGYSLLLPDPVVDDLNALTAPSRTQFLDDMVRLGDALIEVTGAVRMNYSILGNPEPALHAHLFPRLAEEPDEYRFGPAWNAPWNLPASAFDEDRDGPLMQRIAELLERSS